MAYLSFRMNLHQRHKSIDPGKYKNPPFLYLWPDPPPRALCDFTLSKFDTIYLCSALR